MMHPKRTIMHRLMKICHVLSLNHDSPQNPVGKPTCLASMHAHPQNIREYRSEQAVILLVSEDDFRSRIRIIFIEHTDHDHLMCSLSGHKVRKGSQLCICTQQYIASLCINLRLMQHSLTPPFSLCADFITVIRNSSIKNSMELQQFPRVSRHEKNHPLYINRWFPDGRGRRREPSE